MTNASKYINNMPIGERDREDAGNQTIKVNPYLASEAWLKKTAARRQALRAAGEKAFFVANHRSLLRFELDHILDTVNRQIVAEFGAQPKVNIFGQ